LSADAGYYSEDNIAYARGKGIDPLIPPGNTRHTDANQSLFVAESRSISP